MKYQNLTGGLYGGERAHVSADPRESVDGAHVRSASRREHRVIVRARSLAALFACMAIIPSACVAVPPTTEVMALISLFSITDGPSGGWIHSDNWSTNYMDDPCDAGEPWYGVTCNSSGTAIIGIALPNNNLVGDISSSDFASWSFLETLDLHGNLGLGGNPMPALDAGALKYINVSGCGFTGSIPDLSDVPSLVTFIGNDNAFTTAPSSLAGLANLEVFAFDNNQLTGPIPDINGMPNLKTFQVGENQFSYAATSVHDLPSLEEYKIDNNSLVSLPSAFYNLPSLKRLIVFENPPAGVPGSPVPNIAGLPNLEQFLASNANLNGTIPSLSGLANLQVFSISDNAVTGSIPTLPSGLTIFEAENNQLSGVIPSLFGLTSLIKFRVGDNMGLTGLPPDLYPGVPLAANGSSLCPTNLSPTPGAGWNATWDAATGVSPWWTDCTGTPQVFVSFLDRQVLEDLYNGTDGPNWLDNSGWLGPVGTECTWFGVQCNAQSTRVTGLSLAANNLQGMLPGSLSTLPELNYLQISDNGLYGALPSIPPNLLNASVCPNDFDPVASPAWDAATGVSPWYQDCVPTSLNIPSGERQALIDLYNSTQGPGWTDQTDWLGPAGSECTWFGVVCNQAGDHVVALQLADNHLVGTLPGSMTSLTELQVLQVGSNQLSGPLPEAPSFPHLVPELSSLCPNTFTFSNSPGWNLATGVSPWYLNCIGVTLIDGFDPGADDAVLAIAVDANGASLIGGRFASLAGQTRPYFGRLAPDGRIDPSFPTVDLNGEVLALAVQSDGGILLGGRFSKVNGQERNHVARLRADGSLDPDFQPNADGDVHALLIQSDGQIVMGGAFSHLNGQAQQGVARLRGDGSLDSGFSVNTNGSVTALAMHHAGRIVLGGAFGSVNGQARSNLAMVDLGGNLVTGFSADANAAVATVLVQPDGKIVVGGGFSEVAGAAQAYLARLLENGQIDADFSPNLDGVVSAAVQQADGRLVVAGGFSTIDANSRGHVARINLDGSLDSGFSPAASAAALALAMQSDDRVLVGGEFLSMAGQARSRLARVYADGSLDSRLGTRLDGPVNSLTVRGGSVGVGGRFGHVDSATRNHLATLSSGGVLNSGLDPDLDPNAEVTAVLQQVDGSQIYAFTTTNVAGASDFGVKKVCVDSCAAPFSAVADGPIHAMSQQADGKIVVVGGFSSVNGQARAYAARLNVDGSLDSSFVADVDGPLHAAMVLPAGDLMVGGRFSHVGGTARSLLARLDSSGGLDQGFDAGFAMQGTSDEVRTIVRQPDGRLLVGGRFAVVANQPHRSLVRLEPDGASDSGFSPQIRLGASPGLVESLAVQADGRILVSGDFDSVGSAIRVDVARLLANGNVDSLVDFNVGNPSTVDTLAVQSDGKVLIGGEFAQSGGQVRGNFARASMPEAALYALTFSSTSDDAGTVTWQRAGSAPALSQAPVLWYSTDGVQFVPIGPMSPVAGGWQRANLTVPINRNFWLRAEGQVSSGLNNGSAGLVSSTRLVYVWRDTVAIEGVSPLAFVGRQGWRFSVANQSPHSVNQILLMVNAERVSQFGFLPVCATESADGTGTIRCERASDVGVSCGQVGGMERHCYVSVMAPGSARSFFLSAAPGTSGPINVSLVINGQVVGQHSITP